MHLNAVYRNRPGKIRRCSVSFLIEEIAPSSDGLRQSDTWEGDIQHVKRTASLLPAHQNRRHRSENKASVYRKTSGADIDHIEEAVIIFPVEKYIPEACTYDSHRHGNEYDIQQVVR